MKVIIKEKSRVFDQLFKIDRAVLQYEKFDGTMTDDVVRYNFERGNSVAVLVVNREKQTVVLTKQFRFPAYMENEKNGWLLEIVAGMIDKGEELINTAVREVREEIGYSVEQLEPVYAVYLSPGGSSEKIYLYYAEINSAQKTETGGGIANEAEDIQLVELPISEAFKLLDAGEIIDAKTVIALQWLKQKFK